MHLTTLTGAAVLLALAPTFVSAGTAYVVNNCGIPVYYASVAQGAFANMGLMPSGGMSQGYSQEGVGISIKMAPSVSSDVTQFEFTLADGKINYDISNINGNPFAAGGMSLVPSMAGDPNYPSCQPVNCPAGEATCAAAYNQPDDTRTLVCDQASDLTFTLCPGGSMKRDEAATAHPHRIHARHLPKLA